MQPRYSHITPSDRMSIQALLAAKFSCRAIARQLNFHHSSVSREVSRAKTCATASAASYRAGRAQARSVARRAAAGAARRKLGIDVKTPLWRTVLDGLRCHWSPEQIAGKLPRMNTAAPVSPPHLADKLSVSHETIYCAIYAMLRGTLRSELVSLLRKSHKTRLPRARGSARAGGLPNMTSIRHRGLLGAVAQRLDGGCDTPREPAHPSRAPPKLSPAAGPALACRSGRPALPGYWRSETRLRRKTRLWGGFARAARRRSVSDHLRVVAPRAARAPSGGLQPSLRRRVHPRDALQGNLEDTPSLRRRRRLGRLGLLLQKSGGLRHEDPRRTLC